MKGYYYLKTCFKACPRCGAKMIYVSFNHCLCLVCGFELIQTDKTFLKLTRIQ